MYILCNTPIFYHIIIKIASRLSNVIKVFQKYLEVTNDFSIFNILYTNFI